MFFYSKYALFYLNISYHNILKNSILAPLYRYNLYKTIFNIDMLYKKFLYFTSFFGAGMK